MTGCFQLDHFSVMKRYFVCKGGAWACLGMKKCKDVSALVLGRCEPGLGPGGVASIAQWVYGGVVRAGILPKNVQGPSLWPLHSHLTLCLHDPSPSSNLLSPLNEMRPP